MIPNIFPNPAALRCATPWRGPRRRSPKLWGIAAPGSALPSDLFPIFKTGVSVQPIIDAALAFGALLTPEQRKSGSFAVDGLEWRAWHDMHPFIQRHGLLLRDLSERQRAAASAILRASLSAAGHDGARDVMKLNEHAAEITGYAKEFGEWFYWFSMFGEPSSTEPWGWQIDGHHLIINCFILGDQLTMTPDLPRL